MKPVKNYLKNVTKSIAYATADVIKNDLMPNVSDFADTNKEFLTTTYSAIKGQKTKKTIEAFKESKIFDTVEYGAKNLFDDLRTGKFYNKEREEEEASEAAGFSVDDWDDLSEFGIDKDWESKLNKSRSSSDEEDKITAGDVKIADTIEKVTKTSSKVTAEAIATAAEYTTGISKVNTAAILNQNERLFGGLHNDLSVLNATMDSIHKVHTEVLQNIDKNMSGFFTETNKLNTERNAILKEMLEMQRNTYKSALQQQEEMTKNSANKRGWGLFGGYNGTIDLKEYKDYVKKNIKDVINDYTGGILDLSMGGDGNMLKAMMTNPLGELTKTLVKGVIPAGTKLAMKELDKTLSGVGSYILSSISKNRDPLFDGVKGIIGKIFGVDTSINKTINTSKYATGPVPFDGITHKAITEVIPKYLSNIEAALTGNEVEVFDYKSGRYVTKGKLEADLKNWEYQSVHSATYELRNNMKHNLDQASINSDIARNEAEFEKAKTQFWEFMFKNNGYFNPKWSADKNGIPIDATELRKYYAIFQKAYDSMGKVGGKARNVSRYFTTSTEVLNEKARLNQKYREIESNPLNPMRQLNSINGSKVGSSNGKYVDGSNILLSTTDKDGNTIFDYLSNINKELSYQRLNGGFGGGAVGSASGKGVAFDSISLRNKNYTEYLKTKNKDNSTNPLRNEDVARSIERKLANNPYMKDLSAFDNTEKEFIDAYIECIDNYSAQQVNDEIDSLTNSNRLSSGLSKLAKSISQNTKDNDNAITDSEKSTFARVVNKLKGGATFFANLAATPAEQFTNILHTADQAIYDMFFKEEFKKDGKEYSGFLEAITDKAGNVLEKLANKVKEDIIDPFKKRFGFDENWKNDFKDTVLDSFSNIGKFFVDSNKDVWGGMIKNTDLYKKFNEKNKKNGSPVISSNKYEDAEDYINNNSSNAYGTIGSPFMGNTMLSKGELLFNSDGVGVVGKTDAYHIDKPTHILNSYDSNPILKSMGINMGPRRTPSQDLKEENAVKSKLYNHADGTAKIIKFKNAEEYVKKYSAKTAAGAVVGGGVGLLLNNPLTGAMIGAGFNIVKNSDTLQRKLFGGVDKDGNYKDGLIKKETVEAVRKHAPTIAKYGAAGIIPGLMMGPLGALGGLLVGGGIGFLKSNKDFTEKYFGKDGKLGVDQGLRKKIAGMLPGGGVGALAGIIGSKLVGFGTLGTLGLAATGAAVGILGVSNQFREKLLGEEGLTNKILNPLKSASEKIGDALKNGVEKNVIEPLKKFINPFLSRIARAGEFLPNLLNKFFENTKAGRKLKYALDVVGDGVKNIFGKAANVSGKVIGGILTAPFKALGYAGDKMRAKDIKNGRADYMSAQERLDFRNNSKSKFGYKLRSKLAGAFFNQKDPNSASSKIGGFFARSAENYNNKYGMNGTKELDEALVSMNTGELEQAMANIDAVVDDRQTLGKDLKKADSGIESMLKNYTSSSGKKFNRKAIDGAMMALSKGDYKSVRKFLSMKSLEDGSNLSVSEVDQLFKDGGLNDMIADRKSLAKRMRNAGYEHKKNRSTSSPQFKKLQQQFEKLGLRINNYDDLKNVRKLIDNQYKETKRSNEKPPELETAEHTKDIKDILINLYKYMTAGSEEERQKLKAQYQEEIETQSDKIDQNTQKKINTVLGKGDYSNDTVDSIRNEITSSRATKALNKGQITEEQYSILKKYGENSKYVDYLKTLNKHGITVEPKLLTLMVKNGYDLDFIKNKNIMSYLQSKGTLTNHDYQIIKKTDTKDLSSLIGAKKTYNRNFGAMQMFDDLQSISDSGENGIFEAGNQEIMDKTGISNHGIGTFLLGGLKSVGSFLWNGAKSIGSKAVSGVKSAGKGIFNLFKNRKGKKAGGGGSFLDSLPFFNSKSPATISQSAEGLDEVDKPGDGKDVVQLDGDFAKVRKDSDGSVSYDTSDSKTKNILNRISKKNKLAEMAQNASTKTQEMFEKVFGNGEDGNKVKHKPSILGLILGGLVAAPFLKTIFDKVLKPAWQKYLKPALSSLWTDTIKPIATDLWNDPIKPFLTDTLPPLIGKGIKFLFTEVLPGVLKGIFKNDKTISDTSDIKDGALKDKDGNALTSEEAQKILDDGGVVYNEDGQELQYDEDGNIVIPDQTIEKNVKGAAAATAKGMIENPKASKGFWKVSDNALKALGQLGKNSNSKLVQKITGPLRAIGNVGRVNTAPFRVATNEAPEFLQGIANTVDSDAYNSAKVFMDAMSDSSKAAKLGEEMSKKNGVSRIYDILMNTKNNLFNKSAEETAENVAKNADDAGKWAKWAQEAKAGLTNAIEKLKGFPEFINRAKTVFKSIPALKSAGSVKDWIDELLSGISKIFNTTIDNVAATGAKAGTEAGSKMGAKMAAKFNPAGLVISAAMAIFIDFPDGVINAESLLGIDNATVGDELICGIVNALCGIVAFPQIADCIPGLKDVCGVSTICQKVYTWFADDLEQRQKEAESELDDYNKRHGTNYQSVSEQKASRSFMDKWEGSSMKDSWGVKGISASMELGNAVEAKTGSSLLGNFASFLPNIPTGMTMFAHGKYGLGYEKQINPLIANMRFNTSGDSVYQTIGDSGCGPAAAVNAVKAAYGMGAGDVINAANFALSGGYKELNGGTKPQFFKDYFAQNGLNSNITTSRTELKRNIQAGIPTVLDGIDSNGVSANNPYGQYPHYVTATGIDEYGNVIIQDPESIYNNQVYSMDKVLNKTRFGISASRSKFRRPLFGMGRRIFRSRYGRGTTVDGHTEEELAVGRQVWWFFLQNGFSEKATAGVMGNIEQESGMNPTLIQGNGKGPAAGLFQWEDYNQKSKRWKAMSDYAASKGKDWTDLLSQLEFALSEMDHELSTYGEKMPLDQFKQLDNINDATRIFEKGFERAGTPNMEARYKYANSWYEYLTGKPGDAINGAASTNNAQEQKASTSVLGQLTDAFSNAYKPYTDAISEFSKVSNPLYDAIFGTNSGESNNNTSSSGNGSLAGVKQGDQINADQARAAVVGYMTYLQKHPQPYSQSARDPETDGSTDCSSSVQHSYKRTIGIDPGGWTGEQYQHGTAVANGKPDLNSLKPGDLFLYGANPGKHVEMYIGDNHLLGHGSGDGPTLKDDALGYRSGELHEVRRYINDGENYTLVNDSKFPWLSESGGSGMGGNGIKPLSRYGRYKNASAKKGNPPTYSYDDLMITRYGTLDKKKQKQMQQSHKYGTGVYGLGSQNYTSLLNSIIKLLVTIADNSDKLNIIIDIMNAKLGTNISSKDIKSSNESLASTLRNALSNNNGEDATYAILTAMNAIAAE